MLSTSDLSYMRDVIGDLLPDTCNILSVTETADGMGGVTPTWGTTSAGVACRLDIIVSRSDEEQIAGASLRAFQETVLSVPYSTSISTTNRIEHGGYTYDVKATNTDQSWIAVKRATLERVE